ncbi:MAG TPA: hypothetical protein VFH51_09920, partial [Myxococcota bacterium]|nr:hypothetical protein [Myxococcota bacterium]
MLDHGHLRPFAGGWLLGMEALSEVSLPSDILQLVVNRLSLLSPETARLVSMAGATGGTFTPELLASATGMTPEQVARCLEESERASLLERGAHGTYAFVHDRVAEAALERVNAQDLKDVHQALAQALDNPHDATTHMYALARHYAEGHADKNAKRVCETNMTAGLHAVESSAFERGYRMLQLAVAYGEKADIYKDYAMALEEGLGRACAMTGRHQEAYDHLGKALSFATGKNDRFRLQFLLTLTNGSQGNIALEGLWRAFETIGQPYPKSAAGQLLTMQLHWIGGILLSKTGFRRGAAKGEERERRKALSQLHALGVMLALANADAVMMMQFVMRDFWNVHFLGATEEAAVAYSLYGAVMALFGLKGHATYYGQLGLSIADQLGIPGVRAASLFYNAFLTEWKGDAAKGSNEMFSAGDQLRKYLPGSAGTCTSLAANAYTKLFLGHSRSGIDRLVAVRKDLEDTNQILYHHNALIVLWAQLMISGRTTEALEVRAHCDKLYRSVAEPPRYLKLGNCIVYLHVLLDDDASDEEIEAWIKVYDDLKIINDYYAVFALGDIAWFRLRQYDRATDPKQKKMHRRMFWAAFANFFARGVLMPQYRTLMYSMRATLARLDGKHKKALKLLEAADKDARSVTSKLGHFHVAQEHARVARAMGNETEARAHATVALELAMSEGWKNRIARIGREFDLDSKRFGTQSLSASRSQSQSLSLSRSSGSSVLGGLTSQRYADAILRVSLASSTSLDVNQQAKASLK